MSIETQPLVNYQYIQQDDIHELIYQKANREAAEIGFDHILRIYQNVSPNQTVRLLLDFRQSGMMPLNTVMAQGRTWTQRVKVHPTARLAVLARPDSMMSLITPIFKVMRFGHLQTHIFTGDTRDSALEWLRQDE